MKTAGWLEEGEAESVMVAARKTADEHEIKGESEILTLDLGEGWRSIAKAVLKKYSTARVVGVDRRKDRRSALMASVADAACIRRDRDAPTHAEQGQHERQVGLVDRGLGELDADCRVARGGGGRKRHGSCQEDGG